MPFRDDRRRIAGGVPLAIGEVLRHSLAKPGRSLGERIDQVGVFVRRGAQWASGRRPRYENVVAVRAHEREGAAPPDASTQVRRQIDGRGQNDDQRRQVWLAQAQAQRGVGFAGVHDRFERLPLHLPAQSRDDPQPLRAQRFARPPAAPRRRTGDCTRIRRLVSRIVLGAAALEARLTKPSRCGSMGKARRNRRVSYVPHWAQVAELADALGSGPSEN